MPHTPNPRAPVLLLAAVLLLALAPLPPALSEPEQSPTATASDTPDAHKQHSRPGLWRHAAPLNTQITVTTEAAGEEPSPPPAADSATAGPVAQLPDDDAAAAASPSPSPAASNGTSSIAEAIDKALAKEFAEEMKEAEKDKGKLLNETLASDEGKVETVVRISGSGKAHTTEKQHEDSASSSSSGDSGSNSGSSSSSSSSDSSGSSGSSSSSAGGDAAADAADDAAADELPQLDKGVDRIIDSQDNEFVLSAPKDNVATLTLDPLLIQDLTFLFASAAVMGMVFESLKQPVINGYLVAGAIVGPGGLQLIKELVQVESLAQLGVQLLLFNLGRELSLRKLRSVWSVALLGGSLQIVALMMLGGLVAAAVKSSVTQGLFVGALLSMSSTSVVVKCLEAYRTTGSAYGQITIGTLILQDCSVGLMFALMPAFGTAAAAGSGGAAAAAAEAAAAVAGGADSAAAAATASNLRDAALFSVVLLVGRVLLKLVLVLAAALAIARLALPVLLRMLHRYASKELLQLSLVSLCLSAAWFCGNLGLSEELGAFIAGAMMSVAERQLVAAGLLLPSHDSPPPTPKGGRALHLSAPSLGGIATSIGGGGGGGSHLYSEHDSGSASPVLRAPADAAAGASSSVAYYHRLANHAASELLKPGGGGAGGSSGSVLPIHAHAGGAGTAAAAANGQPGGAAAAGGAGGVAVLHGEVAGGPPRPAISMCANIDSIQNVLTALFVASMGLIMSPVFLLHHAAVLLAGTVVVTAVKAAVVAGVVRMFGVPLRLSLAVGLSMAHIGEFSFVLLSMANQLQLLSSQAYMLLLGVTAMSLLTTPFVIMAALQIIAKEGLNQLYISGPRLRLSSSAGGDRSGAGGGGQSGGLHAAAPSSSSLSGLHSSADWAVVMNDSGGATGGGIHRTTGREHRAAFNVARGGK